MVLWNHSFDIQIPAPHTILIGVRKSLTILDHRDSIPAAFSKLSLRCARMHVGSASDHACNLFLVDKDHDHLQLAWLGNTEILKLGL